MSKELLYKINGKNDGTLKHFLDTFQGEPRIAWYPSAGADFRDLLYLNPKFFELMPIIEREPAPPDIFIHTDYFPWSESTFLDKPNVYEGSGAKISIQTIEELPCADLSLDPQIMNSPKGKYAPGRMIFLRVGVHSNKLGKFSVPLIYAFVKNESFCAKMVLPEHGRFSHVIHACFSGVFGRGGKGTGAWLLHVLGKVGCEVFVTDGYYDDQAADKAALELYPELSGPKADLEMIRALKSEGWSSHGAMTWNLVKAR